MITGDPAYTAVTASIIIPSLKRWSQGLEMIDDALSSDSI
jgi:hypothetical protein